MNDKAKDARELYVQALLKQWGENPDPAEAFRLYQASADLGFAGAQNNLGDHYERGQVVPHTDVGAVYWYTRAAERGEPTAYLGLASVLGNCEVGDDLLIEALKYAVLAKALLPNGGNKDLAVVLEGLIAAKLSGKAQVELSTRILNWEPLMQEEYLQSDSPAFTPLDMAELNSTQTDLAEQKQVVDDQPEDLDSLWSYCNQKERVVPRDWNKFYKMLANRRQLPSGGWEPALPLILAAWHETDADQKKQRFLEHLEWAGTQDQLGMIGAYLRSLDEAEWFHHSEL
jgi:TPR repeat protein